MEKEISKTGREVKELQENLNFAIGNVKIG